MDGLGSMIIETGIGGEMTSRNLTTTFANNETIFVENFTCREIQEEFGLPLQLETSIADTLRYIQGVFYIMSFPIAVFLNLSVILLILCSRRLRDITFLLIVQVLGIDLLNSLVFFPTSAANAIAGRFVFTGLCSTTGFFLLFLSQIRIYLMFVLVFDRFGNVFMPFWYKRHRLKVALSLSIGAWMFAFVLALIPAKGLLDCYSVLRNSWGCYPSLGCLHKNECLRFNSITLAMSSSCNVVSLLLYLTLFCKARQLSKRIIAEVPLPHMGAILSEEEKAAAEQRHKREKRANSTFFLLFLSLIGVSLPIVIVVPLTRAIGGADASMPYRVADVLAVMTLPLLFIIDPAVMMRNEDFRVVMKNLLQKMRMKLFTRATLRPGGASAKIVVRAARPR